MTKQFVFLASAIAVSAFIAGCTDSSQSDNNWAKNYTGWDQYKASISEKGYTPESPKAPSEFHSLESLVSYAFKNSPRLQKSYYIWQSELEAVAATKSLADPRISYTYFIESPQTRVGPQNQSLVLSQQLQLWTKFQDRTDIASANARSAWWDFKETQNQITSDIVNIWAELYYQAKSVQTHNEILQLLLNTDQVLKSRYTGSEISQSVLLLLQIRIGELEEQIAALKENISTNQHRLCVYSGISPQIYIKPPDSLNEDIISLDRSELIDKVLTSNPKLKAIEANMQASETAISKAKSQYIPDMTIFGGWIDTESLGGNNAPKDDGLDPITVGVGLNLPIWANRINADIRKAKNKALGIARQRYSIELKLQADTTEALYAYNQAVRKIKLYKTALIPKARESFELIQADFTGGTASYRTLQESLETLLEFELNFHRAIADKSKALGKLEYLSSQPLK